MNIFDGISLYGLTAHLENNISVNYTNLFTAINEIRKIHGYRPSNQSLLLVSVSSQGQKRFLSAIEKLNIFTVQSFEYIDLYPSAPIGTILQKNQNFCSFAAEMNFYLGQAAYLDQDVVVITHCFEVKSALLRLKQLSPNSKVGIAYFQQYLDSRWKDFSGVFKQTDGIDYFSLDSLTKPILGF